MLFLCRLVVLCKNVEAPDRCEGAIKTAWRIVFGTPLPEGSITRARAAELQRELAERQSGIQQFLESENPAGIGAPTGGVDTLQGDKDFFAE